MTDSLTYWTLARNGTCADGEHEDVFGVGYRTREAAEAAARAFLASLDPAVVLARPVTTGCPLCGAFVQGDQECRCGRTVEFRHKAGTAEMRATAGDYLSMGGACEWRTLKRRTVTERMEVDGVEWKREVERVESVGEWETYYPRSRAVPWAACAVRIDRHDIRWAP